jgi:hypothetical protein
MSCYARASPPGSPGRCSEFRLVTQPPANHPPPGPGSPQPRTVDNPLRDRPGCVCGWPIDAQFCGFRCGQLCAQEGALSASARKGRFGTQQPRRARFPGTYVTGHYLRAHSYSGSAKDCGGSGLRGGSGAAQGTGSAAQPGSTTEIAVGRAGDAASGTGGVIGTPGIPGRGGPRRPGQPRSQAGPDRTGPAPEPDRGLVFTFARGEHRGDRRSSTAGASGNRETGRAGRPDALRSRRPPRWLRRPFPLQTDCRRRTPPP